MMTLRMLAVAGLLVLCAGAEGAGATVSAPVLNVQAETCTAVDEFAAGIMTQNQAIRGLEILTGSVAASFMSAFNAMPPESDLDADKVIVLTHPEAPTHLVIFAKGGCLVATAQILKPIYQYLRRSAL